MQLRCFVLDTHDNKSVHTPLYKHLQTVMWQQGILMEFGILVAPRHGIKPIKKSIFSHQNSSNHIKLGILLTVFGRVDAHVTVFVWKEKKEIWNHFLKLYR